MYTSAISVAAIAAVASASAIPVSQANISTAGFQNPQYYSTQEGNAFCVQGNVPVQASTQQGVQLNYQVPANQSVLTETVLEFISAGSTLTQQVMGGMKTISGTYMINARLCLPKSTGYKPGNNVQILTHGVGFDKSYWDVAPGYSYADAAAANGSTTFFYDRLGIGLSEHPDPIQVVQAPIEVGILHSLTQLLRNGYFANTKFQHVVGVGHSFGSILTVGQASQFPTDIDAAILTGFSTNMTGLIPFVSSLNLQIAAENSPDRFYGLNNAYTVAQSIISNQFAFFKAQNYAPALLAIGEKTKQTFSLGEFFTMSSVAKPAPSFRGPVAVVNGGNDLPFCDGNCTVPSNKLTAAQTMLFPNASTSSGSYIAYGAGHGLNLHYAAPAAYAYIQNFIKTAGFA